jgi:hypothetical protein
VVMAKDRIGNKLAKGDKLAIQLPEAQIFGFVAEVAEGTLISGLKRGGVERTPGRVLISCVLALPIDPETGMVAQIVKVYDADATHGDKLGPTPVN